MDLMEWKMNQKILGTWKCVLVDDGETKGAPEEGEEFVVKFDEGGVGMVMVDGENGEMNWELWKEDDMWLLGTNATEVVYVVDSVDEKNMIWTIGDTLIKMYFEKVVA